MVATEVPAVVCTTTVSLPPSPGVEFVMLAAQPVGWARAGGATGMGDAGGTGGAVRAGGLLTCAGNGGLGAGRAVAVEARLVTVGDGDSGAEGGNAGAVTAVGWPFGFCGPTAAPMIPRTISTATTVPSSVRSPCSAYCLV